MHYTMLASLELVLWNILEEYNEDPLPLFKGLQLEPELMYQSGGRYPLEKVLKLWQEASELITDPCFGLMAGEKWHPSNLGTLGYALLMSTSLRDTLLRFIRFHHVIADETVADTDLTEDENHLIYSLTYRNDSEIQVPQRENAIFAWITSILRINYQKPFTPASVCFTHEKPSCCKKFDVFFQCPVYFDSPVAKINISLVDADKTLPSANKELADFNDQVMTKYLKTRGNSTLSSKVTKLIVEHLPSGNATVEKVASDLSMSKRKLQRLLQAEGTSFFNLINSTRKDIAKQYVKDKDMDLTEIAFLLGFSEQSTFSRSFKRWTGKSPSVFRKAD